jgi:alkylation response protein AidB-like acyl-CoA dehydrogenase
MVDLSTFRNQRTIYSEEHEMYRDTVQRFIRTEIEPHLKEWEEAGQYDPAIFRKAGQAGILCPHIPEEYGGGGGDILHQVILQEEQGYSVMGAHLEAGLSTDLASYIIYQCGTEEQKKAWLPRCASGELIIEASITEPLAGSDLSRVRTTAVRDGPEYVINGSKLFISNGCIIDMTPVLCRVGGADGPFAVFLVEANLEGFIRGENMVTMARGSGILSELFFEDMRVPADCLLGGEEGMGLQHALSVITVARAAMCARWLAQAEYAFATTVEFVREREAFGRRVFDFQNTQFKLAEMKAELDAARAYMDKCLEKALAGTLSAVESSMLKLWMSEKENRIIDECLQLHGGMGYMNEHPISKMYTSARAHRIFLGTSEIQKVQIGRSVEKDIEKHADPLSDDRDPHVFGEEHAMFRQTTRRFFEEVVDPHAIAWEEQGYVPRDAWRAAGDAGLLGLCIPPEYGGPGAGLIFNLITSEELGFSIGGTLAGSFITSDLAAHILVHHGTGEQKQRWYPGIVSGDVIQAFGVTEPGAGSDVHAIRTHARRDGNDWVINGSKVYISNGTRADLIYLLAKTGDCKGEMTFFLLDPTLAGVERRRLKTMGRSTWDVAEIFLDEVRVPAESVIGKENRAFHIVTDTFAVDRVQIAGKALGGAHLAYRLAAEYATERTAFGRRMIDYQNSQFKLAEVKAELAVARAYLDSACLRLQQGTLDLASGAGVKLWLAQMENRVVDDCLQLFGGAGYMHDYPISRLYTGARLQRIYAGTDELQKIAIARSL